MKGLRWKRSSGPFNQFHFFQTGCRAWKQSDAASFRSLLAYTVKRRNKGNQQTKPRAPYVGDNRTPSPPPPPPSGSNHAKLSSVLPPFCFNIWQSNGWRRLCVAQGRVLTAAELHWLWGAFILPAMTQTEIRKSLPGDQLHAVEKSCFLQY